MKTDIEQLKRDIPKEYHFLIQKELYDTSTIQDKHRVKELHRANFNRCEKCGYDLFSKEAYTGTTRLPKPHPHNGYVHYFNQHKLVLCDKCVDELNGQPWNRRI